MSGADDVEGVDACFADKTVDMGVDEGEAGACSPVAEKTRFDVVRGDIALDKSVVLEEDHRCAERRVRTEKFTRRG